MKIINNYTRGVIFVAFGKKAEQDCKRAIKSIRWFQKNIPIKIYSDHKFDIDNAKFKIIKPYWKKHERTYIRSSDYYRVLALLESQWDITLYLDNDMIIVNEEFIQGFDLARKFGVCFPQNPRTFQKIELRKALDVDDKDRKELKNAPDLATSYNTSPIFYAKKHSQATKLLRIYKKELERKACRGPIVLWKVMWKTGINVYTLPFEWCICRGGQISRCGKTIFDGQLIPPIILHTGHKEVLEWYKNDSLFDKIRIL